MGERRGVYRVVVGKPGRKSSLGRHKPRWEDNIMMDVQEVGWGDMDSIDPAQDRDRLRALANWDKEPSGSIKCGEFLE